MEGLLSLFAAQVARAPDHPAIHGGPDYRGLDRDSDRMARALVAGGVGPGTVVALRMDRSPRLIAALLAVLKAGGTAFMAGTSQPAPRLADMLTRSGAGYVLGDAGLPPLPEGPWTVLGALTDGPGPLPRPDPARPACIFHTSGTTGRPKLMRIGQAGIIRMAHRPDYVPIAPTTRIAHMANPAFDAFSFEVWGALLNGATLVIVDRDNALDPARLSARLRDSGTGGAFLTTSLFNLLVDLDPGTLHRLDWIVAGGEAASPTHVHRLFAARPDSGLLLVNGYGPTECTTFAVCHRMRAAEWAGADHPPRVPIGTPLRDTPVVLLSGDAPAAEGDWGEILIGGSGVSDGYLGQPDETAARFVTLPGHGDARFYRTGDLGRWRDGVLECGGRRDRQVKLRGHRIELAEVEARLLSHPGVAQAAAEVGADGRLRAFVVGDARDEPALRAHLAQALPDYMLPQVFVSLPSLPLTANGKLDRAALRAHGPAPWDGKDMDPTRSFLQLGGDSLAAARLAAEWHARGKAVAIADILSDRPLAEVLAAAGRAVPRPRVAPGDRHPAASEQQRLWLAQQLQPRSTAYTIQLRFDLDAAPDADRMTAALGVLVARHGALRSAFVPTESGLMVDTLAPWPVALENPVDEESFFARPFDLAEGRLLRAGLIGSTLLVACHHVTVDGASLNLLLADLAALYRGETPPPPGSYAPYPALQAELFESADYRARRGRRARHVASLPVPLADQTYLPAPGSGRIRHALVPRPVLDALGDLARAGRRPLFPVLLGIYALTLWRSGHGTRLSVGVPVGLRPPGFDDTVGMFVNTQLCRFEIDPDSTLDTWLAEAEAEAARMRNEHDVAFEHILADLREAGQHGLPFETMFVLENTDYRLPGLSATFRHPERVDPRFPLTLFATVTPEGLRCEVEHDLAQFPENEAATLAKLFVATASDVATGATTLSDLRPQPDLLRRIDRHVRETPDAPAVLCGAETVSFAALDRKAAALASALRARGAGPGDHIGLALPPSFGMLAGLLAILRIGAAYVPLDPDDPAARLARLATNAGIRLAVGDGRAALPPEVGVLLPDGHAGTCPLPLHDPDATAYLIHTSGSSGDPKAVRVPHRALSNYLDHVCAAYLGDTGRSGGLSGGLSGGVVSTALGFDATVTSLLGPLCMGLPARLLRKGDIEALAAEALADAPRLFKLTPAQLGAMLAYLGDRQGTAPHLLVVGGEQLPTALVRATLKALPRARIVNEYGPTEATVGCTTAWAGGPHGVPDWRGAMPIGRPIRGARIILLNPDGTRTRPGETGEVTILGTGLAAGYLGGGDGAAARFAPFEGVPAYRTGDLALRLPDGELVYRGRADDQLKLNGYRIEPGEIEAAMLAVAGVSSAAVAGTDQLVAFYTGTAGVDRVTAALAEALPRHMRPTRCIRTQSLPLTANGKIDRKALLAGLPGPGVQPPAASPATAHAVADETAGGTAGETATLDALSAIFEEVLGYRISPDQHFFDAGAGSLALMKVHAALRRGVAPALELVDLFRLPTLSQLTAHIAPGADDVGRSGPQPDTAAADTAIAIVGMAVDLPGAPDLAAFWDMIRTGASAIRVGPPAPDGRINAVSALTGPTDFDPEAFGITHRDARLMDPQQRHLMMGTAQALDHAGLDPARLRIGLIAGSSENTYHRALVRHGAGDLSDYALATLHEKDFLVTRIAHHLNLRGPALTVQTACSSSLVAVHQACRLLRAGEADAIVAGGVCIDLGTLDGYAYREGHIFSADGRCAPFSADASGTVPANGWGLVVLRPLAAALAAGDRVMAVVAGSAVNNDGANKVGFTAPSEDGQAAVIAEALARAGIAPADLGYVEAHGTATALGDPIEVAALARACTGEAPGAIALGSVKSQIGHLGAGAGVAGLIRAVLGLHHGTLPPTPGFDAPSPAIDFGAVPFAVHVQARPWPAGRPFCGVSSFGMGGTNAHVVLAPPPAAPAPSSVATPVLLLAERSAELLRRRAAALAERIEAGSSLAGLAAALRRAARDLPFRAAVPCGDPDETAALLRSVTPRAAVIHRGAAPQRAADLAEAWCSGLSASDLPPPGSMPPAWDLPPRPFDRRPFLHPSVAGGPKAPAASDMTRLLPADWYSVPVWHRIHPDRATPRPRIGPRDLNSGTLPPDADLVVPVGTDWPATLLPLLARHGAALNRARIRLCVVAAGGPGPEGPGASGLAMLGGYLRAVAAELPGLSPRLISTDGDAGALPDVADEGFVQLALRGGRLWRCRTAPAAPPDVAAFAIRAGRYLITGGSGGIAQALARRILAVPGTEVILVSRSGAGVPGAQAIAADVTDPGAMARLAGSLGDRPLAGIVHAAGVPGGSSAQLLTEARLRETLAPKQQGTLAVLEHLAPLTEDFILLCSSLSAVVGVAGQPDYGAANAALDACAQAHAGPGPRVISVNWPAWRGTGMSARLAETGGRMADAARALDAGALSEEEAWGAFRHALALGLPQVIVSPLPLGALARPAPPPVAPRDSSIAELFAQMLGQAEVDPQASFYDLGGDSLLGLDLLEALSTRGIDLPASTLSGDFSIRTLEALLDAAPSPTGPVVSLRDGIGPPIVLVHPIGGDVASYRVLAQRLAPGRPVLGLQDPGLLDPEAPPADIERRARDCLALVDGPMSLAGWSFGACIAFTMAQIDPERILDLVLIDPPAPGASAGEPTRATDFVAEVAHRTMLGVLPTEAPRSHPYFEGLSRAWERNTGALARWRPEPGVRVPTRLFVAEAHPGAAARLADWQALCPQAVVATVRADHFGILQPPAVEAVARAIGAARTSQRVAG
ncbi:SDR family NAD(P)-dependent oxidoreductase [Oceaniglobus roseus]|uniref:SDR family NAD(P)-dependent oxidoreductase n=1 Tax=Oceaniglobus roseus TaxID=1737570 RepID=UPI000C7EF6B0|nr:SDR family NAD(P)-dependent oxidoreductase [Kandeliimicrobium roseum]